MGLHLPAWYATQVAKLVKSLALRGLPPSPERYVCPRPHGAGMFVGFTGDSARTLVKRLKAGGVTWVAFLGVWQERDGTIKQHWRKTVEHAKACRAAGLDVWVWGWPDADGDPDAFCLDLDDARRELGAGGVIIDAEGSYYHRPQAAAELAGACLGTWGDVLPLYLTSYGAVWWHGAFPFHVFADFDGGIPQVYDGGTRDLGDDYPRKGVEAWQALGLPVVIPAFRTYSPKRPETPAEWRGHLVSMPGDTAIGWQYRLTSDAEFKAIKERFA